MNKFLKGETTESILYSNFFGAQLFIQLIFLFITIILTFFYINTSNENKFFSYLLIYGVSSILVVIRIGYSVYWGGKFRERSRINFSKTPIFHFYLLPTLMSFVYIFALIIFVGLSVEFPQFLSGSNFIIQLVIFISGVVLLFSMIFGGIENTIFTFIIGIIIGELFKSQIEASFQLGILLIIYSLAITFVLAPVFVFIPVILGFFLQKRGLIVENSKIKTKITIGLTSSIFLFLITIFHFVIIFRLFVRN